MGLGWYYREGELAWVNVAPLAARGIFVSKSYTQNLPAGKKHFGVAPGETSIISLGASLSGFFKSNLMENITMENKFNFYINYLYKIKNVDVICFDVKAFSKLSLIWLLHVLKASARNSKVPL